MPNTVKRVAVKDPDFYYKTQHTLMGNRNQNDLHDGYQIVFSKTGYWDGKRHYGVFVKVFNPRTGSLSATNIKHFNKVGG